MAVAFPGRTPDEADAVRAASSAAAGAAVADRRTAPATRGLDPSVVSESELAASLAGEPRQLGGADRRVVHGRGRFGGD